MAQVNFRMDDALKNQADAEFRRMGLTFSAAIGLLCTQVVLKHRLPFAIETADAVSDCDADRGSSLARRFRDFAAENTIAVPADFKWNRADATEREMRCRG